MYRSARFPPLLTCNSSCPNALAGELRRPALASLDARNTPGRGRTGGASQPPPTRRPYGFDSLAG